MSRFRFALALSVALLLAVPPIGSASDGGAEPPSLLWISPGRNAVVAPTSGASAAVSVDLSALPSSGSQVVRIPVGSGAVLDVDVRPVGPTDGSSRAWVGSVVGETGDRVSLTEHRGVLQGTLATDDAMFVIGTDASGGQFVHRVEAADVGDEEQPILAPQGFAGAPSDARVARSPATIDLMILYTPAVESALGGQAAAEAFAAARITELNLVFANSGVQSRVALVESRAVTYVESGDIGADLERLRVDGDGFMDEIHALRDRKGADLVHLLIESSSSGGLAYRPNPESVQPISTFDGYAFSVASRVAAETRYSSSHEVGHNLGSTHDWANSFGPGYFTYSRGYRVGGQFATVMSYTAGCSCSRTPYFSNPAIDLTGTPAGIEIGLTGEAHNASGFDAVASDVAAFRNRPGTTCRGKPATHVGTPGNDRLVGTSGADVMVGKGGDDTLIGRGGNDTICGDAGDDTLKGGGGDDKLFGGGGADLIIGGGGADMGRGQGAGDVMRGGAGDDRLFGGGGDDVLRGQAGRDLLVGNTGNDLADGGRAPDTCRSSETLVSC